MADNSVSFSEFPTYTQADWLTKIEKDLKGRSVTELDWQLESDWQISPFWQSPQIDHAPIVRGRTTNNWQIGAIISVVDEVAANTWVLEELTGGVNAPLFQFTADQSPALSTLLQEIEARFVSLHFEVLGDAQVELFTQLQDWATSQSLQVAELTGTMSGTPSPELTQTALSDWPNVRTLAIDARPFLQTDHSPVEELAQCLQAGVELITKMEAAGLTPAQVNSQLFFQIAVGRRYFLDIAKLRALRILWANILGAYQLTDADLPPVQAFVQFNPDASMENNMIRTGTQAMAAAIGGADIIFIPPATKEIARQYFAQRIARNVQHLLQMEGKLDRVLDPAAGSYFLENLTDQLSKRAWQRFVALRRKH